ncbi:hypothetical protein D3C87_2034120 [compost metagenome]
MPDRMGTGKAAGSGGGRTVGSISKKENRSSRYMDCPAIWVKPSRIFWNRPLSLRNEPDRKAKSPREKTPVMVRQTMKA